MTRKVKTCVTIQDVKWTGLWYAPSILNTFEAATHMTRVCNKTERERERDYNAFPRQPSQTNSRWSNTNDSISNIVVRRGACKILFLLHNYEFLRTPVRNPATRQNKPKLICEQTSMCVCISISCKGPLWGISEQLSSLLISKLRQHWHL